MLYPFLIIVAVVMIFFLKAVYSEGHKIDLELREVLRDEIVVKAENKKVAAIDFATAEEITADGQKKSEIKKAEGVK